MAKGMVYVRARNLAKEGNWKGAMKELEESPQAARDLTLHPKMREVLISLVPKKKAPGVPMTKFRIPEWNQEKTLILWGKSGVGKTSLAQALLPNALFVNHPDQLRGYDSTIYNGVVFDDMNWLHRPREEHIAVTDTYQDRAIHCRYAIALLPAGTPRIFTTNLTPQGILNVSDDAVARRTTAWECSREGENKKLHAKVSF